MRRPIRSLLEKIEAAENVVYCAFGYFETRPAFKAALAKAGLPDDSTVTFTAARIEIAIRRRRPLILTRAGRRWQCRRWQISKRSGPGFLTGLARYLRRPAWVMADRLLDAAGW
jgi:hypothetical protein